MLRRIADVTMVAGIHVYDIADQGSAAKMNGKRPYGLPAVRGGSGWSENRSLFSLSMPEADYWTGR